MIKIPFCFTSAGICLVRAYDFFEAGLNKGCVGLLVIGGIFASIGFILLRHKQ